MTLNLFETLDKIYTSSNTKFINDVDTKLSPVVINLMLSRNYRISHIVAKLNKYIYVLDIKKYCLLAWSSIQPKLSQSPFIKKIEIDEDISRYDFLLNKIKKKLEISNNDWKHCKQYFLKDVKANIKEYLVAYGCSKKEWSLLGLDINSSKEMNVTEIKQGLDAWF